MSEKKDHLKTILQKENRIEAAEAENVRLRKALEWYASDKAWTIDQLEGRYGDRGKIARAALAQRSE